MKRSDDTVYPHHRLAGLQASTASRRQKTVERLRSAIETCHMKSKPVTALTVLEEGGPHYATISRNPEALALFRVHSVYLQAKSKRRRRKKQESHFVISDSLMSYKKVQLVQRLRATEVRLHEQEQQMANLLAACLEKDEQVASLRVAVAELEPYRDFVEQMRMRIKREEQQNHAPGSL